METILIHLDVPILSLHFDLFVPVDLEIQRLVPLIVEGLEDLNSGAYIHSGFEMLASRDPDMLLNPSCTLREYCILDGAYMMLL